MSYRRQFEQEREEARDILRWLEPMLRELQVAYESIDWHHSGGLATIRVNGVEVDTVAGIPCYKDSVLNSIRGAVMTDIALTHPGLTRGNHLISQTPVLPEPGTTATWVIPSESKEGVPVAEYIREGRGVWELYPAENNRQEERGKRMSSIDPYHYTPDGLELGVEGVSNFVQGKIEYMQHMRDHHEVYIDLAESADAEVLWTMKRLVEVLPEEIKGQVVTLLDLHAQLQFPLLGQSFALPLSRRRASYEEVA